MRHFQNKHKIRLKVYSYFSIIILAIICLFLLKGVVKIFLKERESSKDKEIATRKVAGLKERKAKLEGDIENLKTDVGVEEEIRSKYNFTKPNEEVLIVVDSEEKKEVVVEEPKGLDKFWLKAKGFFSF